MSLASPDDWYPHSPKEEQTEMRDRARTVTPLPVWTVTRRLKILVSAFNSVPRHHLIQWVTKQSTIERVTSGELRCELMEVVGLHSS